MVTMLSMKEERRLEGESKVLYCTLTSPFVESQEFPLTVIFVLKPEMFASIGG